MTINAIPFSATDWSSVDRTEHRCTSPQTAKLFVLD
jgi:hypothetical protein